MEKGVGATNQPRRQVESALRAHGRALLSRAFVLTRSHADAWDLFQATMEKALRGYHHPIDDEKVGGWLLKIMNNDFLDGVRSFHRRARVFLADGALQSIPAEPPAPLLRWKTIDDATLNAAIAQLPPRLKAVFELHKSGANHQEISQSLGVPTRTVATRLLRARSRLCDMLTVSEAPAVSAAASLVEPGPVSPRKSARPAHRRRGGVSSRGDTRHVRAARARPKALVLAG